MQSLQSNLNSSLSIHLFKSCVVTVPGFWLSMWQWFLPCVLHASAIWLSQFCPTVVDVLYDRTKEPTAIFIPHDKGYSSSFLHQQWSVGDVPFQIKYEFKLIHPLQKNPTSTDFHLKSLSLQELVKNTNSKSATGFSTAQVSSLPGSCSMCQGGFVCYSESGMIIGIGCLLVSVFAALEVLSEH